jgi:hypothetical protein
MYTLTTFYFIIIKKVYVLDLDLEQFIAVIIH